MYSVLGYKCFIVQHSNTFSLSFSLDIYEIAECLENIRRVVESRLSPVSQEISDSQAKTREELEALRLRLVSYILLRSSMGSLTDAGAVQEATGQLSALTVACHAPEPSSADLSISRPSSQPPCRVSSQPASWEFSWRCPRGTRSCSSTNWPCW